MDRFDIVVFGASGYTGQYVVEHLANIEKDEKITWCVAGRNSKKLDDTLAFIGSVTNRDLSKVEKIIASVDDAASLSAMCKRAKVIINCVGPYRLWGQQVVEAAIENGCHHLDISGEPIYLEGCQLNFNEAAKKAGVYVVGSAGGDSIPSEMGIDFLTKNCKNDINAVETFLSMKGGEGGAANYGTWHSAVTGLGDSALLGPIRRKLFPTRLPSPKYKLKRKTYFYNDNIKNWAVVLPATDRSVAKRSQYYRYTVEKQRPIQVETYLCPGSFGAMLGLFLFGFVFMIFSSFSFGRKLMLKYPGLFSLGIFQKEGAPRSTVIQRSFDLVFEADVFDNRIDDADLQHEKAPNRRVTCKVSGPDFGYVGCAACISQCALVLLRESDKLPPGGGVYPPGAVFSKTTLISRLEKHGFAFEMLD